MTLVDYIHLAVPAILIGIVFYCMFAMIGTFYD